MLTEPTIIMKCALCGAAFEWDGPPVSEMCCDDCTEKFERENGDLLEAIDTLLSDPEVQSAIDADIAASEINK